MERQAQDAAAQEPAVIVVARVPLALAVRRELEAAT
jgi:hypothetical protein